MRELDVGWQLIEGRVPIFFVASHNFPHEREGKIKPSDIGTGDIVRKLCEEFGGWGMVSTKLQEDPNWYVDSDFRKEAKKIFGEEEIRCVVDVHGRRLASENLIEYFPNRSFVRQFGEALGRAVVKKFVNDGQLTLVEDLDGLGVGGVEVEIREDGRVRTVDLGQYKKVRQELSAFVGRVLLLL